MNKKYLNGIYQAKSNTIISNEEFGNLKQIDKSQLFEYLKNHNYGSGSSYQVIDDIIANELLKTRNELNSLTGSTYLGDIFYLNSDLVNIKIIYKSVKFDLEIEELNILSRFTEEALVQFFKYDNNSLIDSNDLEMLTKIKEVNNSTVKKDLEEIEFIFFEYSNQVILKNFPELFIYTKTKNFITNLNNFLKLRTRKVNKEFLSEILLEQTNFPKEDWLDIYDSTDEQVINKLDLYYFSKLTSGLRHYFESNEMNLLDISTNDILEDTMKTLSYDHNSIGPVYYYLYLKQAETGKLRAVYYG